MDFNQNGGPKPPQPEYTPIQPPQWNGFTPPPPVKRRFMLKLIIAISTAVVAIGAGVIIFFMLSSFETPRDKFLTNVGNFVSDNQLVSSLGSPLGDLVTGKTPPMKKIHGEYEASLELDFNEKYFNEYYYDDMSEVVNTLNSMGVIRLALISDIDLTSNAMSFEVTAEALNRKLNGFVVMPDDKGMYLSVPDLYDLPIYIDYSELEEMSGTTSGLDSMLSDMSEIQDMIYDLLSLPEEDLKKVESKISDFLQKHITEDMVKEKTGVSFKGGNHTELVLKLDGKQIAELCAAFCEEVLLDEEIMEIIKTKLEQLEDVIYNNETLLLNFGMYADVLLDSFDASDIMYDYRTAIKDLIDEIEDSSEPDATITISVIPGGEVPTRLKLLIESDSDEIIFTAENYVQNNESISSMLLEYDGSYDSGTLFSFRTSERAESGGTKGTVSIELLPDDYDSIIIELDYVKRGDTYTGGYEIITYNTTLEGEYEYMYKNSGGTEETRLSFTLSPEIDGDLPVVVTFGLESKVSGSANVAQRPSGSMDIYDLTENDLMEMYENAVNVLELEELEELLWSLQMIGIL